MPNYGDPIYWDQRYSKCENSMFDWLEDYNALKQLLSQYIKPEHKILIVGCGNANFSEDMYDDGFEFQYNIDISSVVINQMKLRNKKRKNMVYEVMDCCDMKYPDNFFDIAIDKSTIDAILCGDNAYLNTCLMLKEGQRVLKEGGIYIAISYGKPESRSVHFERPIFNWKLNQYVFYPMTTTDEKEKEESSHYIYVCTKQPGWLETYHKNFEKEIVMLILNEKSQSMLQDGDEDDMDDMTPYRVSLDLKNAKIKSDVGRSKSKS